MLLKNKVVKVKSLEVDGVHMWDFPDFADAYFMYAEYEDGTPLSDEDLDLLTTEYPDVVNKIAHENLY